MSSYQASISPNIRSNQIAVYDARKVIATLWMMLCPVSARNKRTLQNVRHFGQVIIGTLSSMLYTLRMASTKPKWINITHENVIATTSHIDYFFLLSVLALTATTCATLNDTSIDTVLVVLYRQDTRTGITLAPLAVSVTASADVRGTQTVAIQVSRWRQ
jgi:hypothetical protein